MKTKKTIQKVIIGVAAVALCIGGITFAKYRTQINGNGEAKIAKWSFQANQSTETINKIELKDTYNEETLVEGKIAPGTSGNFGILIDATGSEVGIDYNVKFENAQNKPTNLKFTYDGQDYNTLDEIEEKLTGTINANEEKTKDITIGWKWDYETQDGEGVTENDKTDTTEGTQSLDYKFDVVITGTQVNPTKSA